VGTYAYLPLERVVFGQPAAQAAAEEAARIGARKVFIVASKSLSRKTAAIREIQQALGERYAGLFDECIAHTPWPSVIAAADAVRAAQPDLILTVGGGTPIDTVKILQICLAHDIRRAEDLEGQGVAKGPSPVRQIAVPTTLSGAEFSNLGGGTDLRTRIKHSFTGADIGPRSVILDPAITLHTPMWLWLSTGIRGVDHAVEALCSVDAHPYADGLAP
jgi:maleylacetate reductase